MARNQTLYRNAKAIGNKQSLLHIRLGRMCGEHGAETFSSSRAPVGFPSKGPSLGGEPWDILRVLSDTSWTLGKAS